MLKKLRSLTLYATLLMAALPLSGAHAADKLKIGVLPGTFADAVNAALPEAKAQGLDVQVVEFTDWVTPNIAVASGDLDVNLFQSKPWLDIVNKKNSWQLGIAGPGILQNLGLYSVKHKSLQDIPQNGKAAIANDPVNQGRALLLLEKAGLIKLKPGVGFFGTLSDITENPKNLQFVEVEGPKLALITRDVDIAQGYPSFISASKAFDPSSGFVYTGVEDIQFNVAFVTQENRVNDPVVQKFLKVFYDSKAVKDAVHKAFNNDSRLYLLAWQQ